jgi:hypothetical protein
VARGLVIWAVSLVLVIIIAPFSALTGTVVAVFAVTAAFKSLPMNTF